MFVSRELGPCGLLLSPFAPRLLIYVGWDQRSAGPPLSTPENGGPALAMLAGPTLRKQ